MPLKFFQRHSMQVSIFCWVLLVLLIIALGFCLFKVQFKNFMGKFYGFIDVENIDNKEVLEKELDFINKDILGFAKLALGVATTLAGFFKAFDFSIFFTIGIFGTSYIVLHLIEMSIKSSHKNKIIEKLQKLEKKDEKTITCS